MSVFINSLSILLLASSFSTQAWGAACLASDKGILKWQGDGSTNSVLYCDGSNWQNTDHGSTAVSCSGNPTGTIIYASSIYRFCATDGFWHTMKGSNIGTCATAGNSYFNGLDWVFCDGVNLYSMNPNLSCAVTLTSGTSWPAKTSFAIPNQIKVLGGGGGGGGSNNSNGGAGGGGGAYNAVSNVTLTFPVTYSIGAAGSAGAAGGGTGGTGGDTWFCSSSTGCANINDTNVLVGAKGGTGGQGETTAGVGGQASSNKPVGGSNGGSGFLSTSNKGGGGGGGAGPSGVGLTATSSTGAKGDNGAGGAAGAAGTEWGSGVGSGGGGTGGNNASVGNAGGNYGAGGGGSGKATNRAGGAGTGGLIYITWTSTAGNCN